jgi:hypothetical protein
MPEIDNAECWATCVSNFISSLGSSWNPIHSLSAGGASVTTRTRPLSESTEITITSGTVITLRSGSEMLTVHSISI